MKPSFMTEEAWAVVEMLHVSKDGISNGDAYRRGMAFAVQVDVLVAEGWATRTRGLYFLSPAGKAYFDLVLHARAAAEADAHALKAAMEAAEAPCPRCGAVKRGCLS